MNLVEPLRAIFRWEARPEVWALPLGPGRWHVLDGRGKRPLLLPVGGYGLQQHCLSYFEPRRWKALYGKALLRANLAFPGAELLPEFRLAEGARGFLPARLPFAQPACSAVRIGTAGPCQKASVLLLSEGGTGLALAKVAMVAAADHLVTGEAGWLRELEAVPELEDHVPRLLAEGVALTGRRYLITTLAPDTRTTNAFTPAHGAFLGALGRVRQDMTSFAASPCLEYLETSLARLEQQLTRAERETLQTAVRDCRSMLARWTGPFVYAHGDFVPWNIRVEHERVFVFDWEYAKAAANPLADAFNYFVMQQAVSGYAVGPRFMAGTARRVEMIARQLYPEWSWRARVVSALGLAYLLEVLLRSAAGRNFVRTQPVTGGYLRLLEQRSAWMAT